MLTAAAASQREATAESKHPYPCELPPAQQGILSKRYKDRTYIVASNTGTPPHDCY